MFPKELNPHFSETNQQEHKKSSRSKHTSSFHRKKERGKTEMLLSMPTKSEISFEKMISLAQIHREANRPLIKIKDFDGQTKFCQCCSLPSKDDIYLRNCSFCENTDKFAEFGRGTSLYFSFFRFAMIIMFFALLSMALPAFFLTSNYTSQITDACQKIYNQAGLNLSDIYKDCLNFINVEGVEYDYTLDSNDWEFRYNSRNLITYKNLFIQAGKGSRTNINKVITNYNILHFIGLLCLFIISVLYMILLANINKQHDMDVTSPGDFTIIISNLYSAFEIFWKNINNINTTIKARNNRNNSEESKSQEKTNYSNNEMKEVEEIGLDLDEFPKGEDANGEHELETAPNHNTAGTFDSPERGGFRHADPRPDQPHGSSGGVVQRRLDAREREHHHRLVRHAAGIQQRKHHRDT